MRIAFARAVEAALGLEPPPRAVWLRALMAELERLANHFGDIGAICNDASFSLMHAHCGILREHVLRVADACFGHRLMMDRVVPGGVAADLAKDGAEACRRWSRTIRRRFPELIELYDSTASLQDRTVTTGILKPELARQYGAGGFIGRASGRAFDARKTPGYAPYDELRFEVPVRQEGDVDARVWVRIDEVKQSPGADRADPRPAARRPRPRRADAGRRTADGGRPGAGRGLPRRRAGLGAPRRRTAQSRAATCAIRPGSSGRCWRPPSKATSSPTSRSATNPSTAPTRATTSESRPCASCCSRACSSPPLTEAPPAPDDAALAELAQSLDRAARRRLGRSLSIREVDAGSCNGCELEIHALNNAFYDLERFGLRFVASPRHADVLLVTGPVTKNMREALERTYAATPDPKWVVAVGDCALDGGIFAGSYAVVGGVSQVVPVDLHIRGCPPSPTALLKGLLALVDSADRKPR